MSNLPDTQTKALVVSDDERGLHAPAQLAAHPVWHFIEKLGQSSAGARGNLNVGAIKRSVIDGWLNGWSPVRSLYLNSGLDENHINILLWSVINNLEIVDIDASAIDVELLRNFSLPLIKQYNILPLYRNADVGWPVVALCDLNNMAGIQAVRNSFPGEDVHIVLAEKKAIEGTIEALENDRARTSLTNIMGGFDADALSVVDEEEEEEADGAIIRLMRNLLEQAVNSRVSDIHIDPEEDSSIIKFRIDGILQTVTRYNSNIHQLLINYIKSKSGMDISKSRIPQDGGYRVRFNNGAQIHLRTATIPSDYKFRNTLQEKMTIRLISANNELVKLDQLGLTPDVYTSIVNLLDDPAGMVILCGPTNSGKTTTLYAMINHVRNDKTNIMTVEDPIEKHISGVNQSAVNVKAGMTYAAALQSFLRHDPDIILVGEIRGDEETVNTAINASLAGKLVLTTIHTSSVVKVPSRLMSMGVEPYTLVDAVRAFVSQRLVRRLCDQCKEPLANSQAIMAPIVWPKGITPPEVLYKPHGCPWCRNTGYRGRMAVAELLLMDNELENMILNKVTAAEIKRDSINRGVLRPLADDILIKIANGETSLSEMALAGGA